MFSKALFKQSAKANGLMWAIITFADCFMLACVMMISGGSSISATKNAFEDTIVSGEIDSQLKQRAINYYQIGDDGLQAFDGFYVDNYTTDFKDTVLYSTKIDTWFDSQPVITDFTSQEAYLSALTNWKAAFPAYEKDSEKIYAYYYNTWLSAIPVSSDYTSTEEYQAAYASWSKQKPSYATTSATSAYATSVTDLKKYEIAKAKEIDSSYTEDSTETKEMLGVSMYALKPTSDFDDLFTKNNETVPADYDVQSLLTNIASGNIVTYLKSNDRMTYIHNRASNSASIFLANVMTDETNVQTMLEALSKYGVTKEKYEGFGYTYTSIKDLANTNIVSFQARYDYELGIIDKDKADGKYATDAEYNAAVTSMTTSLTKDISNSLLASLPTDISNALEEVGQMDLYSLVVGTVFYKMSGLLLPIIYMIMASNNLIAGQVDSGSMAYVLSTSTKRNSVVFTQAMYLVLSLLGMFACTTITSCICLSQVTLVSSNLNYTSLCLMNLGSFLVLFALSGVCFLTSCWFDRSKTSMAIGGGLSMFSLVATMLGLFGTEVIPTVIRLQPLNYFNYVSIITLFDVTSIIDNTTDYIWKFGILLAIGLVGYIIGSIKFEHKDLPL